MSEREFQKALMHLYANIDRYSAYSDEIFAPFVLSPAETQSLRELMASQRRGLLVFNQQLDHKRRRVICEVLSASRAIAGSALDVLLDGYASGPTLEGARGPGDVVRDFAEYVNRRVERQAEISRPLDLIRFEANYAAVSLGSPSASGRRHATLISCEHDVAAAMTDPSLLDRCERCPSPRWFFMFMDAHGDVRVRAVASDLAAILRMLLDGAPIAEALETLADKNDRAAARESVGQLLSCGAPLSAEHA